MTLNFSEGAHLEVHAHQHATEHRAHLLHLHAEFPLLRARVRRQDGVHLVGVRAHSGGALDKPQILALVVGQSDWNKLRAVDEAQVGVGLKKSHVISIRISQTRWIL